MKRIALALLLLAPAVLSGCQTLKAHNPFRHREAPYKSAQQERPLEVPPGMDQPPTSEALTITETGAGSVATNPPAMTAPPAAAAGPAMAPATTGPLVLADTQDSVYHRVGLALDRAGVGQVTPDDANHSYQVAVNTTVQHKSEGGFFHRLFHRDKTETVNGTVTVAIVPSGNGSEVQASGDPGAAARVMAVLRARLQ